MKNFVPLISLFLTISIMKAQNVGIGISLPTEKLDIDGAIRLGTTTNDNEGTIKYEAGEFQGRTSIGWVTFGSVGGSSKWSNGSGSDIYRTSNVGIGVVSPTHQLHVGTDIRLGGVILSSDGSVTNPSISFFSDPNSGIFLSAPDQLSFTTAGTERIEVGDDGKVKISDLIGATQGVIIANTDGTLTRVALTGSADDVLRGDGTFGKASSGFKIVKYGPSNLLTVSSSSVTTNNDLNLPIPLPSNTKGIIIRIVHIFFGPSNSYCYLTFKVGQKANFSTAVPTEWVGQMYDQYASYHTYEVTIPWDMSFTDQQIRIQASNPNFPNPNTNNNNRVVVQFAGYILAN